MMILIDTNIISEMMKHKPDPSVIGWIDKQNFLELYVSTINIAEILYGIRALPQGKRRVFLEEAFKKMIQEVFEYRVLGFDENAADNYGSIMSQRKSLGRPLGILDGQIAAIAKANYLDIATRNIKDFSDCGINLINPFL